MKNFALCGVVGALAFVVMGFQNGLFQGEIARPGIETTVQSETKAAPKAKFPQDLAVAVRNQPVPQAAEFKPTERTHRLVFLKPSGTLHSWQEDLKEDWQAETVEDTELVVVVGPQHKTKLSVTSYANGAPPIERVQYDLEAWVVEAKTGKVLASRQFQNIPRAIKPVESWELTTLGQVVPFRTVFNWVVSASRAGFPSEHYDMPLVSVVD